MATRRRWALVAAAVFVALVVWRQLSRPSPEEATAAFIEKLNHPVDRASWRALSEDDGTVFEEHERMRLAGEPTSAADLAARGAPSRDEDAAWRIEEAVGELAKVPEMKFDRNRWPASRDPVDNEPPENLEELAKLVPRYDAFVDRIAAAMTAPRCRFRLVYGDLGLADHPQIHTLFTVRDALSACAVASTSPPRRLQACRLLLVIGQRDEPLEALDLMMDVSMVVAGLEAIRFNIERGALAPVDVRKAIGEFLVQSQAARLAPTLLAERIHAIDVYRSVESMNLDATDQSKLEGTTVSACAAYRAMAELPTAPVAPFVRRVREIATHADATGKNLAVGLVSVARRLAECDAATRLARIALAAAEHRATHGDFPATLDELKPMFPAGVPLDPFTDAAFVYEKTATGVRIASAGRLAEVAPLDEATLRERVLVWELKR